MTIKALVQRFLSERAHAAGETVEFGWFIFRIAEAGQPPRVESLDFREMASFTEDFSEAERIQSLQTAALAEYEASECPCTLWQFALVSVSYSPERDDVFLERQQPTTANDSGWYVGVLNERRDLNAPSTFIHQSLYELTIRDMRMAPYWLLPPGIVISLGPEPVYEEEVS